MKRKRSVIALAMAASALGAAWLWRSSPATHGGGDSSSSSRESSANSDGTRAEGSSRAPSNRVAGDTSLLAGRVKAPSVPLPADFRPPRADALHPMSPARRRVIEERSARASTLNTRLEAHLAKLRVRQSQPGGDTEALRREIATLERNLQNRRELETLVPAEERPGARR